MSDKEIDEILEEIKRHAMQENSAESSESEAEEPEQRQDAFSDIIKMINEEDTEEADTQEEPEAADLSFDDEQAEEPEIEPEENDVDFSLPEEEKAVEEAPEEEVSFTIPAEETKPQEEANEKEENFELLDTEESEAQEEAEQAEAEIAEEEEEEAISLNDINLDDFATPNEELDDENAKKKSKKPLIIALAIILIIALGVGIYFGFFHKKGDDFSTTATKNAASESTTVTAESTVLGPLNPLTGESGYNQSAIGKRPVAVVVENEYSTESVRPQWGINEADIVLEGESEYSTRLLFFWADYTNMPSQIGSTRSARPPFIRFSQLFDSVFIHAGLSKSKGNYVGANTVFESENVDHINLLTYSEDGTYFGRDRSRTSTIEHTGYLNGKNTASLLEKAGVRTDLKTERFSSLEFNESPQPLSDTVATSAKFVWSDTGAGGHCPKVGRFYYDTSLAAYSTNDFDSDYGKADVEFQNLIFLLDKTEYVVKSNYKGSGNSETYCDYKLSGGKGMVLSQGTAIDITWGVESGKLWMKDSKGNNVKLNPGKSYIGYGSSNKGGGVVLNYDNEN